MASKAVSITSTVGGVFEVNINDPENQNRLSEGLCSELMDALTGLTTEPTLKVLLLTGRNDVFCAGATLDVLKKLSSGNACVSDLLIPSQMLSFPVPILGALEGHAVGGGLILAICCDILVAAESSRYGVNFTDLGFTPGMGTTSLLPALVGHFFASEMILTAKFYNGRELKDRGIFNYVVRPEQVREVAMDMAQRIAEKPRHVLEMVKNTLAVPRRLALQEAMSREHLMHRICFSHPDTGDLIKQNYQD